MYVINVHGFKSNFIGAAGTASQLLTDSKSKRGTMYSEVRLFTSRTTTKTSTLAISSLCKVSAVLICLLRLSENELAITIVYFVLFYAFYEFHFQKRPRWPRLQKSMMSNPVNNPPKCAKCATLSPGICATPLNNSIAP